MDIQIDKSYEKPSILIRYAAALFYKKENKNLFGSKLVEIANELNFYAYPMVLMNTTSDPQISGALKPNLTEYNSEKIVLEMNQEDSHFIDSIGVSDIEKNINKIFEAYNHFYECGNFDKLIRACYRFLKRIKGANEYDMNDIVIRYMFSCICMNDYSNCINIIENIGQNYFIFDYNIYIFLLYFIQGKYEEACQKILQIQKNVCEDFYTYIKEKDLAFYFSFCLLYNFNSDYYKQILSNNDTLVYILYDKYNEYFQIVDKYYKCDYLNVNTDFNTKLKDKIKKDPFLSGFSEKIEYNLKKKILKEILSFTSEINFETIQNLLLIKKKDEAEDMVIELIKKEKLQAIIDDIEGVVIIKEKKPLNEILEKSNNIMEKNLKDLIKYSINKNIKHRLSSKKFTGKDVERKLIKESEMDIDLAALGMAMPFQLG